MDGLDLGKIREELDDIDRQIAALYKKRIMTCTDVAEYKISAGKAVLDPKREQEKLKSLSDLFEDEFDKKAIEEMYKQIMTISRRYQYMLMGMQGKNIESGFQCVEELPDKNKCKVVYQGVEGAYSHMATVNFFGEKVDSYHVEKWEDAVEAVELGKADYAVVPIENSKAGSVTDTYDLLIKHNLLIAAEYMQAVSHALLAIPGAKIDDIKTVYSHPQGLLQCSEFLNDHREWKHISLINTAVAAKKVFTDQDKTQAAIASVMAGNLYGLKSLEVGINRNAENMTRFVILTKSKIYVKKASKISIVFELPHKSGSLYNLLGNLIFNDINMLKIESRPIPNKNFEYRFFVDIEGNLSDAAVQNALIAIESESAAFRILGNY